MLVSREHRGQGEGRLKLREIVLPSPKRKEEGTVSSIFSPVLFWSNGKQRKGRLGGCSALLLTVRFDLIGVLPEG